MSTEYGGTRSVTSDNAVAKGTNPVFNTVPTVNNDHGSAAHAGFDGEEKNDLKLDTVPISAIDHQSAILACSDRFPVLDSISPLTILTGKDDCHLDSAWKTDNASPQPSGCKKRKRKAYAICEKSVIDLGGHMRHKYRPMTSVEYSPNRGRKSVATLTRKCPY
jgi:hypothetical protein